ESLVLPVRFRRVATVSVAVGAGVTVSNEKGVAAACDGETGGGRGDEAPAVGPSIATPHSRAPPPLPPAEGLSLFLAGLHHRHVADADADGSGGEVGRSERDPSGHG
ncbi:hypothetical protein Vretimale_645, partial [Volvox reticuliferus]